jgi:hypothetical protein
VKNLEFFLLLLIQGLIKESEDKYLRWMGIKVEKNKNIYFV